LLRRTERLEPADYDGEVDLSEYEHMQSRPELPVEIVSDKVMRALRSHQKLTSHFAAPAAEAKLW